MGAIRSQTSISEREIIFFDWASADKPIAAGIPVLQSVVADGDFDFPRQGSVVPEVLERFTYTPTGTNLGFMQAFPLDANTLIAKGFFGLSNGSNVVDNGAGGDEVAGDGIYNDGDIWASSPSETGTISARAAITSTGGAARFVDFPVLIRDAVPPVADFAADVTSGEAPLTVAFTNTSGGGSNFTDWDSTYAGSIFSGKHGRAGDHHIRGAGQLHRAYARARVWQ